MNTQSRTLLRSAHAIAFSATVALAQQPYGSGTGGTGGQVPVLSSTRPQLGDASFGLDLQCASPSSIAFVVLGLGSGSFPLNGITVNLAPQAILTYFPSLVSANGNARFPLPIPNLPTLAGVPVFAQAAVVDSGGPFGFSGSRGLRFAVGDAPRVFVACSILGNDPFHYVDPVKGTSLGTGAPVQVDNATAAVFDEAGNRVFVASSIRGTVGVGDTSKLPIAWSTLFTGGSSCYGLSYDAERDLLWTLTPVSSGSRELVAIDVDARSSNYGKAIHNTTGVASGAYERWGMAPSGDLAGVLTLLPSTLTIVDTDPKSATFLKNIYSGLTVPVDGSSPISLATQVAFTPDERYALVTIQLAGATPAEVARLDLATGAWVDHNGPAAGTNIGAFSSPPVAFGSAPTTLRISDDGRYAIVGGFGGCGWVGRLDLDPKNPRSLAWQAFQPTAPLANGWTAGLAKDETEIAVATWPASGCSSPSSPQLVRIDVRTGKQLGTVSIPANTNGGNQNWYVVEYR